MCRVGLECYEELSCPLALEENIKPHFRANGWSQVSCINQGLIGLIRGNGKEFEIPLSK